ncbi:MAG: VOC family protein [Anaerolineales bacterium]
MKIDRIYETVLYAGDLHSAEEFYRVVLGLDVVRQSELLVAFQCGEGVLLIFNPDHSGAPGRDIPSHGATGPGHLAFAVDEDDFNAWKHHLETHDVEIEAELKWESGGRSVYFRDPAGNSLELAVPTIWST